MGATAGYPSRSIVSFWGHAMLTFSVEVAAQSGLSPETQLPRTLRRVGVGTPRPNLDHPPAWQLARALAGWYLIIGLAGVTGYMFLT